MGYIYIRYDMNLQKYSCQSVLKPDVPNWPFLWNVIFLYTDVFEPGHVKMFLMSYAKNKGADQTAHNISSFYSRNF